MTNAINPHANYADSAGQTWQGRTFEVNPHAGDDGTAPAKFVDAVTAFRSGESFRAVVDAFRTSRFLIPLIAVAGEEGMTEEGLRVDKTQELSIVTVAGPDGRSAMPVFSSVEAMARWNADARPVPAVGVRVALAAAGEGTANVVIDPGSATRVVVRRPALWAIAQGQDWCPAHTDEKVAETLSTSVLSEPAVRKISQRNGDPESTLAGPDLEIELVLDPGLSHEELNLLLERLTQLWYADAYFADHVDQLGLKVVPAAS